MIGNDILLHSQHCEKTTNFLKAIYGDQYLMYNVVHV